MDNGRIIWVTFYLKKGPEWGLIFRMGCHHRIDFGVAAAAAVVAADSVTAVAVESAAHGFADSPDRAG